MARDVIVHLICLGHGKRKEVPDNVIFLAGQIQGFNDSLRGILPK